MKWNQNKGSLLAGALVVSMVLGLPSSSLEGRATETSATTTTTTATQPATTRPTLTYKVRQESEEDAEENVLLAATFQKPVVTNPGNEEAAEYINEQLSGEQLEFVKRCGALLANQTEKDIENGGFVLDETFHAGRFDSKIASFLVEISGYTGGEKGTYEIKSMTFDMATGEKLTIDDIATEPSTFRSGLIKEILSQCEELGEHRQLLKKKALENAVRKLVNKDAFLFTETGLLITTAPGELCATGQVDRAFSFVIPYTKLTGLKDAYKAASPRYTEQQIGMSQTADLDGDGVEDKIFYDYGYDIQKGDDEVTLTINDKDYSDVLRNNGLYVGGGYPGYYLVVDVDKADSTMEILIPDGNKQTSYLFSYQKDSLSYLGALPGIPDPTGIIFGEDGVVHTTRSATLLEDYRISVDYQLNEKHLLEEIPAEWYDLTAGDGYSLQGHSFLLEEDLEVYPKADTESESFTLEAGKKCYYVATDDSQWLEGRCKDGTVFYENVKE